MRWAGAAERHQHEIPRVESLFGKYAVERADHVVVGDADDGEGRLLQRQTEMVGDRLNGGTRGVRVEASFSRRENSPG